MELLSIIIWAILLSIAAIPSLGRWVFKTMGKLSMPQNLPLI